MTSCLRFQLAEQGLIGVAGPELAHDGGGVLEIFDVLEQRDGLQAGVAEGSVALDLDAAEAREPEHVEDVFGDGRSADDVLLDGFGSVGLLELGDGAEGVEDLGGLRSEGGRKVEGLRLLARFDVPSCGCPAVISAMAAAWRRACWRMSSVWRWRP